MKRVTLQEVINEIDERDIIIGLRQIAVNGKNESARVSAWNSLARIRGIDKGEHATTITIRNIYDSITDNIYEDSDKLAEASRADTIRAN